MYSYSDCKKHESSKMYQPKKVASAIAKNSLQQASSYKGVIQMETDDNPYSLQDGRTGHHIIPHSLLNEIMEKFDSEDSSQLKKMFIPELSTLTLRQLDNVKVLSINDKQVYVAGKEVTKASEFLRKQGIDAPIGDDLRKHINSQIGEEESEDMEKIRISKENPWIQDSFYEWQKGNQFRAIRKRAEAGKSFQFDEDAKYFYGEVHASKLKVIYLELEELKSIYEKVSKNSIIKGIWERRAKELLTQMAEITMNVGETASDDRKKWIEFPSNISSIFNENFLPAARMKNISIYPNILKDFADEMRLKTKVQASIDAIAALSNLLDKMNRLLLLKDTDFTRIDEQRVREKINKRYHPMDAAYRIYKVKHVYLREAEDTFWIGKERLVQDMKTGEKTGFEEIRMKVLKAEEIYQKLSLRLSELESLKHKL